MILVWVRGAGYYQFLKKRDKRKEGNTFPATPATW